MRNGELSRHQRVASVPAQREHVAERKDIPLGPLLGSVSLTRARDGEFSAAASGLPPLAQALLDDDALAEAAVAALPFEPAHRDEELDRLATLAAAGDRTALERLLELVRPPIVRYCRARLGSRGVGLQMAEDVAQDVLVALCGALPRYQPGKTRVMAFVYGIASNKVVDAFRAAGRDQSEPTDGMPETPDGAPDPESVLVLRAQADALWSLLDLLPAQHREVLVMRVAMRFTAEQTAEAVGSTPGAVRVIQHRALARLRKLLAADRLSTSPSFDL